MSIDRDHFPINPNGNTADRVLLPMEADPTLMSYPDRTYSTLPIVAANAPEAPLEQTLDGDPSTPWYKTKLTKAIGIIGVPLVVLGGGYATMQLVGAEKPAATSTESKSDFPQDVVYGSGAGFSELPAAEQAAIRRLHNLSPQEFGTESLENRYKYNQHVIDTNTPHIIEYSQKRSPFTGIPALVNYGPALASDTAVEVEAQRAIKVAIASRLIDTHTGLTAQNYPETLKLAAYIFEPGSFSYNSFVARVQEAEKQGKFLEDITPCTVLESRKEGDTVTYSCKMQYTEESDRRFTHAVRSATWIPFTDYDGKPSGNWVLTRNDAYRFEPHL